MPLSLAEFVERWKAVTLTERAAAQSHFIDLCEVLGHATLLDSVGAPIGTTQALLGHESAETTKGFYLRSVSSDAQKAVAGVGEKLIGPKWTQVGDWPEMGTSLIN